MSDTSNQEKTERPSPRRLEKAHEEGTIARAPGLPGAAVLLAGAAMFAVGGSTFVAALRHALETGLRLDAAMMRDPSLLFEGFWQVARPMAALILPFALVLCVVGIAGNLAVGGWIFSARRLAPDFTRIDPVKGLTRLVSRDALFDIAKSLVQLLIVGAVAYVMLRGSLAAFVNLGRETVPGAAGHAASLSSHIFLVIAAALAGVVAIEVPYRLWAHRQRLMMTRQELRDEMRELEVSPHTKRRIRTMRNRFARSRMMSEVQRADVVITNPDHYAAALRYQEGKMRAPRLVAKGTGLVALRIREIAVEAGVPVVEAPPLARAINRYVDLEEEIPIGLYKAVAEVLAHIYRLKLARDGGRPAPAVPRDGRFDPPEELRV